MTKNSTYIISGGTNYYISGGQTKAEYTGSGTPWTSEATTPYGLALNEVVAPPWVPQAAQGEMQYIGGAPFAVGNKPLYRGYNNKEETLSVTVRANSKDNAISLLRQLNRILNTALFTVPAILAVQGGTNTAFFEIYEANVQEDWRYVYEDRTDGGLFRTTATWKRSPTGSLMSSGESLLSSTLNNRGTGSPLNNAAYSTGNGDLIYEGSPLNIVATGNGLVGTTYGGAAPFWVASILANTRTANTDTVTTSNSAGVLCSTLSTFDLTPLLTNRALKLRICIETDMRDNSSYQARCFFGTGTSGQRVYTSPWVSNIGNFVAGFLDLGYIPNDVVRRAKGMTAPNLYTQIYVRPNGGISTTYTMQGYQMITYYDWGRLDFGQALFQGNDVLQVDSFPEQTGAVLLPYIPRALVRVSSTGPKTNGVVRGTAPRYFAGSRFFFATVRADGTYNGGDNWGFVITHAPQYRTLRGAA